MTYLLLVVGFVALIKGADWLVEGAASIAKKFQISDLVIGLTVVAFGTSAPELVVNLMASFSGKSDLAIGNIVGSNIANFLLVLGATAVLKAVKVDKKLFQLEIPFAVLCIPFLAIFSTNFFQSNTENPALISRADAFVLILAFAYFIYRSFSGEKDASEEIPDENLPLSKAIFFFVLGLAGLVIGGNLIVDSASELARSWGMSEAMIGLTIVAVGTSLPEVAASVAAALKGNSDMAIGNVLGSNIFNVLWVLAVSALIKPLPVSSGNLSDFYMATLAGIIVVLAIVFSKKDGQLQIGRFGGILFLALYSAYTVWLVIRG